MKTRFVIAPALLTHHSTREQRLERSDSVIQIGFYHNDNSSEDSFDASSKWRFVLSPRLQSRIGLTGCKIWLMMVKSDCSSVAQGGSRRMNHPKSTKCGPHARIVRCVKGWSPGDVWKHCACRYKYLLNEIKRTKHTTEINRKFNDKQVAPSSNWESRYLRMVWLWNSFRRIGVHARNHPLLQMRMRFLRDAQRYWREKIWDVQKMCNRKLLTCW